MSIVVLEEERQQSRQFKDEDFPPRTSLLSNRGILRHIELGNIVISPFVNENLSTSSYDVTLGPWYYRECTPEPGQGIYNPFSEKMVQKVWGHPHQAEPCSMFTERTGIALDNISASDRIIWLTPGETILAHTNEFIGGRNTVTTMMKARSSLGRNFIEICKCAGWGDIGYINRWTMEITNNSRHYSIPLVVGRRVAQIVFFDSDGTLGTNLKTYEDAGKYQKTCELEILQKEWQPTMMLPRMFEDRDIKN